jgi:predicted small lipoprotein YifL
MKLLVVSVLVACGSKDPPPALPPSNVVILPDAAPVATPPDGPEDPVALLMTKMNGFADEMCACRDKACADVVQEGMTKWSTQMASDAGSRGMRKATEKELEQITNIGQRYGECMTKAGMP